MGKKNILWNQERDMWNKGRKKWKQEWEWRWEWKVMCRWKSLEAERRETVTTFSCVLPLGKGDKTCLFIDFIPVFLESKWK